MRPSCKTLLERPDIRKKAAELGIDLDQNDLTSSVPRSLQKNSESLLKTIYVPHVLQNLKLPQPNYCHSQKVSLTKFEKPPIPSDPIRSVTQLQRRVQPLATPKLDQQSVVSRKSSLEQQI